MYNRTVKPAPAKAVIDGKPMYGTYNTPLEDANLIDAPKPFTKRVPRLIKHARLQRWQALQIGDGRFFAMIALSPNVGLAEVKLYDRRAQKGYSKMDLPITGRGVLVQADNRRKPTLLERIRGRCFVPYAVLKSRRSSRGRSGEEARATDGLLASCVEHRGKDNAHYRIRNTLAADGRISFELKSDDMRFFFEADFAGREPIVAVLPFSENRPFYSHKALAPGKGYVELGGERIAFDEQAYMIVDDQQAYYPHRFWYDWVTCAEYQDGKLVGLQLTTNQIQEPLHNNENCVWHDGRMYPLPNVHFYRCRDRTKQWFIKDDLGMVDLVFEPIDFDAGMQLRFGRKGGYLDFYVPFGYLTGAVTTGDDLTVRFDRVFCTAESKDGQYLPDSANIDN